MKRRLPAESAVSAYLDIETSWSGAITVIGVYRPNIGTQQLVSPKISAEALGGLLEGVTRLFTYNGSRFDLPVILRKIGVDLKSRHEHIDLMLHCWSHQLKGGLKGVERTLGIARETEGIDGLAALHLWDSHCAGDSQSLALLLRYNREDVENLEILEAKLRHLDAQLPEKSSSTPRSPQRP